MRFSFDQEQREFASALRSFLEKECTADHLRDAAASETGRSSERWARLAEMGVVGFTVPTELGGLGMDEVGLALLLEETGRAALPEPVVETTAVAVPLLAETGSDELKGKWLPGVAEGRAILTVGLEANNRVSDAHVAYLLILQAGEELHAVTPDRVELRPQPSLDPTRRLFSVDWTPGPETLIAEGDEASRAIDAAFDRGALGAALQLLGLAGRMIEMGAEYAKERQQFGKPIGSFQAVKQLLADALIRLEFTRPVVYRAAYSVAHGVENRSRDVSMAKALASEAAAHASRASLQVHGAIGYTEEHDLHLWLKRARALAWAWGNTAWHRDRVATAVLGPGPEVPG
ncbi:MAG: acyl-CoA dehydrogenase family protein [Actinomycetota bacterium]